MSREWNSARYLVSPRRRSKKLVFTLLVVIVFLVSGQLIQLVTGRSGLVDGESGLGLVQQSSDGHREELKNRLKQRLDGDPGRSHRNSESKLKKSKPNKSPSSSGGHPDDAEDNDEEEESISPLEEYLRKVIKILITSKPRTGFELPPGKSEPPEGSGYQLFPRMWGEHGIVNIAAHDTRPEVPVLSERFLGRCLHLPHEVFDDLATSHFYATKWLPQEYPEGIYQKGNGVVMVGGGKFSWFVLLALENLRAVGCKIPAEILIPTEAEYEELLCEHLFPPLGAKCIVLTRRLPFLKRFENIIGGYQYKSLAILSSSFENVLLLDADNVAVRSPDYLFNQDPFKSYGLVLWPDYWKRVTHPDYYKLAKMNVGENRVRFIRDDLSPPELYVSPQDDPQGDIPLHDREGTIPDLTTESGQILVNKRTHMRSLLLSLYYNLYGPHQYYPLFSQGGEGEGDKETFLAAAAFYGEPAYRVKKTCDTLGYWMESPHKFVGVGMVQHDPVRDFKYSQMYKEYVDGRISQFASNNPNYKKLMHKLWNSIQNDESNSFNAFINRNTVPQFYHCNFPKMDPVDLKDNHKLYDENGDQQRFYTTRNLRFDFEMRQWMIMKKYFCNGDLKLKYYTDQGVHTTEYCRFIDDRIDWLSEHQS